MTDQPKPNQPPATPNTAETKPSSTEGTPAPNPAPVTQSKPADPNAKSDKPVETTRHIEPPKPLGDAKPVTTETKPESAPSVPTAPAQQTTSAPSAPPPTSAPAQPVNTTPSSPAPSSAQPVPPKPDAPDAPPPTASSAASSSTEKPVSPTAPTIPSKPAVPSSTTVNISSLMGDKDDTIPPSSNGGKVTQRFSDPTAAAQTSMGVICPNCGHRNRPGTLMCDNCGTNLIGGTKAAIGTRDLVSATEAAATTSQPMLDAAQLNAVESAGGSVFTDDMVLRIEIEGGATPMLVYPKQEIILGRRDPNTGTLPDVDLTAYSGYRMGVSRTHASIRLQDKQLNLSDRGSSNGTFLNGTRLVAHRPYPIKDGDEIRLGQMVLKIYFQSNKTRK